MLGGLAGVGARGGLAGVSSSGAAAAAIGANAIDDTMLRAGAARSVIGRSAATGGNVADIAAGADGTFLGRIAGTLAFAAITGALLTGFTAGRIPFASAGGGLTDEAAFTYDAPSNTVFIGSGTLIVDGKVGVGSSPGANEQLKVSSSGETQLLNQQTTASLYAFFNNQATDHAFQIYTFGSGYGASPFFGTAAVSKTVLLDSGAIILGTTGATSLSFGTNGAIRTVIDSAGVLTHTGRASVGRLVSAHGGDIAAAANLALPATASIFRITAGTAIDYIQVNGGGIIILQFNSGVTLNHDSGSPPGGYARLKLDFGVAISGAPGVVVGLYYDSQLDVWFELFKRVDYSGD